MTIESTRDNLQETTPVGFEGLPKGPKLALPDVTLVCVDTAHPLLALRVVQHCMRQIEFGAAVLITRPDHGLKVLPGLTLVTDDTIHCVADYSRFMIRGLLPQVRTSHCLIVQWDGFVTDTTAWDPRFLEFDYIGAVWERAASGRRVGNGGFSLRSRRLLEALRDPDIKETHPEDFCLSNTYRELLEQRYGIRFADEATARRFSIEGGRIRRTTFGIHRLDTLYGLLSVEQFMQIAVQLPGPLFRGAGARHVIADAVAREDGRLAFYVLRQRRKYRRSFWSCMDLWVPVWWACSRSMLSDLGRRRPGTSPGDA